MEYLMAWIHSITSGIVSLGYPGVYIAMVLEGLGMPFPGDAFLAFYGYAVSEQEMNGIAVWCIGSLGYFTGVSIIFWLVRKFGSLVLNPLYRIHILSPERLDHTSTLMRRFSALVLIPGRFLPGIRSLSTYAAAFVDMPYSTFTAYTIVGSIIWCGAWIGLGFWFGENVQTLLKHVQSTLTWVTIVIVLLALLVFIIKRLQSKTRSGQ
ncbi:DedA family protein [Alicyclobacillus acidoterrestris]|uniref:DedA family protein n=1 Tax=Alicyclobacillus suci TaxID=2816080 RepID=UPI001192C4DF|nr:DedA family protein [Alicyclobacillus suci]GEO24565.1 DedA family protein [Alicyclobacillus acidoterrestris]